MRWPIRHLTRSEKIGVAVGEMKQLKKGRIIAMAAGALGVAAVLALMVAGCSHKGESAKPGKEEYHADNDIAMTLKSVSDAFQVNEPLREMDYRFEGVLTDGAEMPLYTDIMGSPGQWQVEVVSERELRIHNLYLGDLLPENLQQYIVQSLDLGEPERSGKVIDAEGDEMEVSEYKLPGGIIRIETSEAVAANGVEGPLMSISVRKSTL